MCGKYGIIRQKIIKKFQIKSWFIIINNLENEAKLMCVKKRLAGFILKWKFEE